ncbi:hypothetical protein F5144DRAFT_405622 [Chaetomium tenue]|uniref:Uncharacterized protein n=1 Tax=Chaetomium tenue TaxID=1854479 RepID=A0ACB7NZ65_9PEZI|nr:hypothetical protein F5144DRAFT_405622 [Chaetomium globosum]
MKRQPASSAAPKWKRKAPKKKKRKTEQKNHYLGGPALSMASQSCSITLPPLTRSTLSPPTPTPPLGCLTPTTPGVTIVLFLPTPFPLLPPTALSPATLALPSPFLAAAAAAAATAATYSSLTSSTTSTLTVLIIPRAANTGQDPFPSGFGAEAGSAGRGGRAVGVAAAGFAGAVSAAG